MPGQVFTPDRRLRVFISSTLSELGDERDAARRAVEALRLIPVMFESGARSHPPRALYRAYLEQSDVFIGIYWQSYGWVAQDMDISGIEDEFQLSRGKPSLFYVKSPAEREPRLDELIERIGRGDFSYKHFGDPDQLQRSIENDIAVLISERFMTTHSAGVESIPTVRSDIPLDPTSFIGRGVEVHEAEELLMRPDVRLVTLVGAGGMGKTRLATKVATRLAPGFEDGVFFVPLASVAEGSMVGTAIASSLEVRESAAETIVEAIADSIADRQILLVLDNFEHVIEAAPVVSDLLAHCPRLKILVTSRFVLHLRAEFEYHVDALTTPQPSDGVAEIGRSEAVQLFVERARATREGFTLDEDSAAAVAEICRAVDGSPLGIELAAARIRLLTPEILSERLRKSLDILGTAARDVPDRQKTIRRTIEWSYGLLDDEERDLFARLGVFAGSFTLEAADAICGDTRGDLLEGLASLVDKSLITAEAGSETRFRMLRVITESARERLLELKDADTLLDRHAAHFADVARKAFSALRRPGQHAWMVRLERDNDNMRAAFRRLLDQRRGDEVAEASWRLWLFWWTRGQLEEGRQLVTEAMTMELSDEARAYALGVDGVLAMWLGDYAVGATELVECRQLFLALDHREGIANSTLALALITAVTIGEEEARRLVAESVTYFEENGDLWGIAAALNVTGWILLAAKDHSSPETFIRGVEVAEQLGDDLNLAMAYANLADHKVHLGLLEEGRSLLDRSMRLFRQLRTQDSTAYTIESVAIIAVHDGEHDLAARLLGAADKMRRAVNIPIWDAGRELHEEWVRRIKEAIGEETFTKGYEEGMKLTFTDACDEALVFLASEPARGPRTPSCS